MCVCVRFITQIVYIFILRATCILRWMKSFRRKYYTDLLTNRTYTHTAARIHIARKLCFCLQMTKTHKKWNKANQQNIHFLSFTQIICSISSYRFRYNWLFSCFVLFCCSLGVCVCLYEKKICSCLNRAAMNLYLHKRCQSSCLYGNHFENWLMCPFYAINSYKNPPAKGTHTRSSSEFCINATLHRPRSLL